MTDTAPPLTKRRAALAVVVGLWLVAFCGAFIAGPAEAPVDAEVGRGVSNTTVFLSWQIVAAALAVPAFWIGNGFPPGSGLRRISRVPIVWGGLLLAGLAVLILLARF